MNNKSPKTGFTRQGMAAVVVALVLLVVLLSTGRVMSAQGDDKPVPPEGTSSDPSPYVDIAPTD
ncbi:MAG TPA: hypothetical protein VF434_10510, partial [Promineifilum sp.]